MKSKNRIFQLSVTLLTVFSMSTAIACTTTNWNGGASGSTPLAGDPETALPRVSGVCAMNLSEAGIVQDLSPVADPQAFIRFYVMASLSANTTVFEAFSDDQATSSLFSVAFDGDNFIFDAGNGASTAVPANPGWNLVELAWVGGSTLDYWVNADATSETKTGGITAQAGLLESVALGNLALGVGDTLGFDDYVSHRISPIGPLLMGDANGSGGLSIADVISLFNELNGDLSTGQPDCNSSGGVSIADAICLFNAL